MTATRPDDGRRLANHPVLMRLLIDIGVGFSIFVLAMITWAVLPLDSLGFLFSGIPVFLITALLALAVRVRGRREGVRRGVIWAGVFAVCVLVMVIGNQTFYVFGSFVYVPVAATALLRHARREESYR